MEINKTSKFFYFAILSTMAFILLLGSWWLYLTFKLSNELERIGFKSTDGNVLNMVKWEGSVFLVLIILITSSLLYMYVADKKKSSSINLFFASLTHELKTPLASIKLQAQVLSDLLSEASLDPQEKEKIQKYVQRLHESSFKLENELDNHLQLSRVERNGVLNLKELSFSGLLTQVLKDYPQIKLDSALPKIQVRGDEFALKTICRNILENILVHGKKDQNPKVLILEHRSVGQQEHVTLYQEGGQFKGDSKKLATLFYKHNSPKGSGLGLYLVKKLMEKMKGKMVLETKSNFKVRLVFPK